MGQIEYVGLIAEGRSDQEVLVNLLKGCLDLDHGQIVFLRPELRSDETDLHAMPRPEERGSYLYVIDDCKGLERHIRRLEGLGEEWLLIIHLDAAEAHRAEFELGPLDRGAQADAEVIRPRLIAKIAEWAGAQRGQGLLKRLRHAIAVQEIEAWLLAIHDDQGKQDTAVHHDPKVRLMQQVLPRTLKERERKRLFQMQEHRLYAELSKPFRKKKDLQRHMSRNLSLRLFCETLKT